jgi:transposase
MQPEEWRPFFDGDYEVSNLGNVRRAKPGRKTWVGRPLKAYRMRIGYLAVNPVFGGKNVTRTVHSLVAEAFLGPANGREVNHIDGDKANPRLENLEYVTHRGNMQHAARTGLSPSGERHPSSKLSDDDIAAIRRAQSAGASYGEIAKRWGITLGTVHGIVNRKTRPDVAADVPMGPKPKSAVGSRSGVAKLDEARVAEMRERYAAGASRVQLAREFGVSYVTTDRIVKRMLWRHVP